MVALLRSQIATSNTHASKSTMKTTPAIIPYEPIERLIRVIRGQRMILDTDLAQIYGVLTWRLNEQVKRNRDLFPADFMFQLTMRRTNL
jgi:hypothetical protein